MPPLAASVHIACPQNTPAAVNSPPRLPPAKVPLTTTAVSGPGVMMTTADTPANAINGVIRPLGLSVPGRDRRVQARPGHLAASAPAVRAAGTAPAAGLRRRAGAPTFGVVGVVSAILGPGIG